MTQRVIHPAVTDPSFLAILASLLAMLANKPGRAQLVWLFAGSVMVPVLAAVALWVAKERCGQAIQESYRQR